MLPSGPVFSEEERAAFDVREASSASYRDVPRVDYPVLPLMIFGVTYDLDIIVATKHPTWNMHELARIDGPEGPLWLAKDARWSTMSQSIVVDLPDPYAYWPEIPVTRKSFPLRVEDKSRGETLDLRFRYENMDGEAVDIRYRGPIPHTRMKKRNGSTMRHSRDVVMAVLDLPLRDFGKRASVTYDGRRVPMRRLAGLIPFQMALTQTQGGMAVGSFVERPSESGFSLEYRLPDGSSRTRRWSLSETDDVLSCSETGPMRTLSYRFLNHRGALELYEMVSQQRNDADVTTRIRIRPALPDLRRPFQGLVRARFVVDIHGERGLAHGDLEAYWEDGRAHLRMRPREPWWVADRPMDSTIAFADDGSATIRIERVE